MKPDGAKVLIAGVGNVFLGDDGFGVEVASRLAAGPLPPGVIVKDFGVGGVHLAFELLDGYDTAILVDAVPRGVPPGSVFVLEPDVDAAVGDAPVNAHGLEPETVLALVRRLGGEVGRVLVVGCEPATVDDGIGLSPAVAEAVEEAVDTVRVLVAGPGERR